VPRAYVRITVDAYEDPRVAAEIHSLVKIALQAYRPPKGLKLVAITPTMTDAGRQGGDELVFEVDPNVLRMTMQAQGVQIPRDP